MRLTLLCNKQLFIYLLTYLLTYLVWLGTWEHEWERQSNWATNLSRPGHAQTRTSIARRPSTKPSGDSRVKITWTGRRLSPPTHELKQWNSSSVVTHSAPAVHTVKQILWSHNFWWNFSIIIIIMIFHWLRQTAQPYTRYYTTY